MDFAHATLRWLYNNAPQGILTTDRELNIRGWNRWLEECSGRSAAEMVGRNLLNAFPELAKRRLDTLYHQALAGHTIVLSYRFHRYLLPLPVQQERLGLRQMPQSAYIGPLTEDEQIIGTITIIQDVTDRVTREEELKHYVAVQDALHEIDRAILSLNLSDCLRRVVEKISALVGAPVAAVVLSEPEEQEMVGTEAFRVAACIGGPCAVSGQPVSPDSIAAWSARSRQAILIEDVQTFLHSQAANQPLQPDSRSIVAAPLIVENRVIGALVVESPRPYAFTEAEQSLVIALATQAAIAIHNARLHNTLQAERNLLRTLVDNLPDQIYAKDAASRFILANCRLAEWFGLTSPDELIGKTDHDVHPDVTLANHYRAEEESILRSGEPLLNHEEPVIDRFGNQHWFLTSKVPVRNEQEDIIGIVGISRDITDQKAAQERIRFQAYLLDTVGQAVIATDAAGRVIYWNRYAETLYGWSAKEVMGRDILEVNVAPEALGRAAEIIAALRQGQSWTGEFPVRRKDGTVFPALVTNTPILDNNSTVVGMVGISTDLTERKQMEETERQQRILAEALRDTAAALTSTLSFDEVLNHVLAQVGRVVPYDAAVLFVVEDGVAQATRVAGRRAEKLERLAPYLRFPIAETADFRQMAETGQPLAVADTRQDSAWVDLPQWQWIRSHAGAPLSIRGELFGFLKLYSATPGFYTHELVSRLQAFADQAAMALENARLFATVRRRAEELEALYQTALATTATLDPNALLAELDRQVRRLIPADALYVTLYDAEKQELEVVLGVSDDVEGCKQAMGQRLPLAGQGLLAWVARTGQTLHIGDVTRDPLPVPPIVWGQVQKRAWLGVPLLSHDRLIGVITVQANRPYAFSDDNRRLLEALAAPIAIALENAQLYQTISQYAAELEQRVAERTAELEAANQTLQEANAQLAELNRVKDQFVANVSHELRTPLANIVLLLSLLDRGKPEKRDYYLATIKRETNLLQRLIENLLSLSRLDMGKTKMRPIVTDLNYLVGDMARGRAELLASRGLSLNMQLDPSLPLIEADAGMLAQVFTNLLTNAMNYTQPGGTITVSTALRHTEKVGEELGVSGSGTWVTLSVSDTGLGILPSERARLFERFFRGEAARQMGAPGIGLGLAICHEIVRRHNGHITVESTPGEGSTFTVWLPILQS